MNRRIPLAELMLPAVGLVCCLMAAGCRSNQPCPATWVVPAGVYTADSYPAAQILEVPYPCMTQPEIPDIARMRMGQSPSSQFAVEPLLRDPSQSILPRRSVDLSSEIPATASPDVRESNVAPPNPPAAAPLEFRNNGASERALETEAAPAVTRAQNNRSGNVFEAVKIMFQRPPVKKEQPSPDSAARESLDAAMKAMRDEWNQNN